MNASIFFLYKSDKTETIFIDFLCKCILIISCFISSAASQQAAGYLETFDTVSAFNELLTPLKWHAVNFVPASSNILDVSSSQYVSVPRSLKAFAVPSGTEISKASIERKGYNFVEGDTVFMQASFYFEPEADLNEIFLMDIECEQCYSQAPGPRLKVSNGFLSIDRGKIGFAGSFKENKVSIPTGKWFRITWQMVLGKNSNGSTMIFLNGQKVMDTTGTNMPDREIFSANGVTLVAEKLDRFEVGLTANSSSKAALLYVDDVSMGNAEAVNVITNLRQTITMETGNRTYNILFNLNSDNGRMTSGVMNFKTISYYDMQGRLIRTAGMGAWGNGVYIASFSNRHGFAY